MKISDTKFELTLDQCSVVTFSADRWAVFKNKKIKKAHWT